MAMIFFEIPLSDFVYLVYPKEEHLKFVVKMKIGEVDTVH